MDEVVQLQLSDSCFIFKYLLIKKQSILCQGVHVSNPFLCKYEIDCSVIIIFYYFIIIFVIIINLNLLLPTKNIKQILIMKATNKICHDNTIVNSILINILNQVL